jgi:hypothetical protein
VALRTPFAATVFSMLLLLSACARQAAAPAAVSATPISAQWAAIGQLPDFSGSWTQPAGENLGKQVFADCCLRGTTRMQLTPKYAAIRDSLVARLERGESGHDNLVLCLPDGLPGILQHGLVFQLLFQPGEIIMLIEDGEVRRIHTDGRAHPPLEELYTSPLGHSIGRWEGNTLVVDTVGIRTDAMLFFTGAVNVGKRTHIVERMFLKGPATLRIETTIDDPDIFTAPYSYPLEFARNLREQDFEVGCRDANRDTEGKLDLTPPPE